jgi:hypothetical protein
MGKVGKMKKILFFLVFLFTNFQIVSANPIMLFFFSELMVDSSGWKIELHLSGSVGPQLLDGWYLATMTDTAYFKNGIVLDTNYLIITPDSLTTPLFINRKGDRLTLCEQLGFADQIIFGEVNNSLISAPGSGQSICLREYRDEFQRYFYYLDNTPTLGGPNDTTNAYGTIQGTVTDSSGNPLDSVKVIYDYENRMGYQYDIYVLTDSSGQFTLGDYARIVYLEIEKDGYEIKTLSVQIWPDSNTSISIIKLITGIGDEHPFPLSYYKLEQSYPNPFNPTTTVSFVIGHLSFVTLKVHDILGREIATLVNDNKPAGEYKAEWNAEGVPSGVYFYRIVAVSTSGPVNTFTQVKKMVVLR